MLILMLVLFLRPVYMFLTDRCQVESASHMAVTKSVKRLNTHIIFEIICIYEAFQIGSKDFIQLLFSNLISLCILFGGAYYTPGIYAEGYIVFVFPFVRSYVRMFVRSFVCSFVRSYFLPSRGICVKVLR